MIADACARRYGHPIAAVLAARTRWMTALFYAAPEEHRRETHPPTSSSDQDESASEAPSSTADGGEHEQAAAGLGPGSQPIHGVPVQRATTADTAQSRRKKGTPARTARPAAPTLFDLEMAGTDPLPEPGRGQQQEEHPGPMLQHAEDA